MNGPTQPENNTQKVEISEKQYHQLVKLLWLYGDEEIHPTNLIDGCSRIGLTTRDAQKLAFAILDSLQIVVVAAPTNQ